MKIENLSKTPVLNDTKMSVKEAMRQLAETGEKILFFVGDQNHLKASLTDGDIRRWVLQGGQLTDDIDQVYNTEPITIKGHYDREAVKELMLQEKMQAIPVVDSKGAVLEVLLWDGILGKENKAVKEKISLPVVIMAGGKGTRLDPFTRILPKPLIPIGEKALIEYIMDKFNRFGIDEFYVSVNHKSKMIRAYFDEINPDYRIHYIEEDEPLGTAGGLRTMRTLIKDDLLVSNCDIIIEHDYAEMVHYHRREKYDMTIIGSFRHFTVPYGVCTIENGGELSAIQEKPEYDFLANTGMYILTKKVLGLIPENKHFNITDLAETIKRQGGKVGVFPIDERSWIDVGQWEEYHASLRRFNIEGI